MRAEPQTALCRACRETPLSLSERAPELGLGVRGRRPTRLGLLWRLGLVNDQRAGPPRVRVENSGAFRFHRNTGIFQENGMTPVGISASPFPVVTVLHRCYSQPVVTVLHRANRSNLVTHRSVIGVLTVDIVCQSAPLCLHCSDGRQ